MILVIISRNKKLNKKSKQYALLSVKGIPSFILRTIFIAFLSALLFGLITRDFHVFQGNRKQAEDLISLLLQIEATVGALVITILLLVIEIITTSYNVGMTRIIGKSPSVKSVFYMFSLSLGLKIWILANPSYFLSQISVEIISSSIVVDGVIILISLLTYRIYKFAQEAFKILSPEDFAYQILEDFDNEWMETIRGEWLSRWGPSPLSNELDPLIPIERILLNVIEKKNLVSFRTIIFRLERKLIDSSGDHDGPIIDKYLAFRFSNIIQALSDENYLDFYCEFIGKVTDPSKESLLSEDISFIDVPSATIVLRQILKKSIELSFTDIAFKALLYLDDRALVASKTLPDYSNLYFINPENRNNYDLTDDERTLLWENDSHLLNYINGYLDYFGDIAVLAIEKRQDRISGLISSKLNRQFNWIINNFPEEQYQIYLIRVVINNLYNIVNMSIKFQAHESLDFSLYLHGARGKLYYDVAKIIADYLSWSIDQLSRIGNVTNKIITDIAISSQEITLGNSEAGLLMLKAFGEAGKNINEYIVKHPERKDLKFILNDMRMWINQIEGNLLIPGYITKAKRFASKARKLTK